MWCFCSQRAAFSRTASRVCRRGTSLNPENGPSKAIRLKSSLLCGSMSASWPVLLLPFRFKRRLKVKYVEKRAFRQITWLCQTSVNKASPTESCRCFPFCRTTAALMCLVDYFVFYNSTRVRSSKEVWSAAEPAQRRRRPRPQVMIHWKVLLHL